MELRTVTLSLQGKSRANNEDSYFADAEMKLMIVADGMGGYLAGEVASTMAVNSVVDSLGKFLAEGFFDAKTEIEPEEVLKEAFYCANDKIYTHSKENEELSQMGSTLTVAWVIKDKLYIAHVGDTRAYFFGDGKVEKLTLDHSVPGELLKKGGITEKEAEDHPKKHMLTRALGAEPLVEVDVYCYKWPANQVLLLSTDGLNNQPDLAETLSEIGSKEDKTEILAKLVKKAEDAGILDDITGVLAWQKTLDKKGGAK